MQPLPLFTLSVDQTLAIENIFTWFNAKNSPQIFRLGGYAGTGKTTIIKQLLEQTHTELNAAVCAFTGKACYVLQKKGIKCAQTIHSLIYHSYKDGDKIVFKKRIDLESDFNLIIVDEASMVSTDLYRDLLSYGIKILFIGDPGQLEPVGDNPNLMRECNFILTNIHRQAAESPIITLASNVRQGGLIKYTGKLEDTSPPVRILPNISFDRIQPQCDDVDQIICAKNTTRNMINRRMREHEGYNTLIPQPREKIICLRNNPNHGVFNGLILYVIKAHHLGAIIEIDAADEIGKEYKRLPVWAQPFLVGGTTYEALPKRLLLFDFAYAITCHKAQGSEWENVIVIDEPLWNVDQKRWRYTAITRASQKLTYFI